MYIVGFNGPPQCGKDTLAEMLAMKMDNAGVTIPVFTMPLSWPLRDIAFRMVGRNYAAADYEDFKKERFLQFANKTGRQLMIDISESFLKSCYGDGVMARIFLERVASIGCDAIVLIPDCGFSIEVATIPSVIGQDNFYLVRVFREGTTFVGDSRERVEHRNSSDVYNNGNLDDLRTEAHRIYGRLVNQMGWKF